MPTATRPRRPVRQKAKGPIDPELGRRLRLLRESRGLTQAALAGDDFTKGYISLIETGRTRVSLRAAEIIATRLGMSVAELLQNSAATNERDIELLATRAEMLVSAGNLDAASGLFEVSLRRARGILRARLLRTKAHVLIEERRAREAIALLDEALRTFRGARQHGSVVRTIFDLARAHSRLEQPGEALNLALEAERALISGELVDRTLELQVTCFIAAMYVTLGDYGSADLRTERAKVVAEEIADPRATAQLYESLAITRQEQGDYEAALAYATRALRAYETLGERALIGSSWNTIGWVYVQRKQFGRASEALVKAQQAADETHNPRLRGYVLQTKAELELARGRAKDAIALADASLEVEACSPRGRALSLLVKAQALAASGAPFGKMNDAFNEAFTALEPFGRRQLARAYELHFTTLMQRERYKEAAESAHQALALTHPVLSNR